MTCPFARQPSEDEAGTLPPRLADWLDFFYFFFFERQLAGDEESPPQAALKLHMARRRHL